MYKRKRENESRILRIKPVGNGEYSFMGERYETFLVARRAMKDYARQMQSAQGAVVRRHSLECGAEEG